VGDPTKIQKSCQTEKGLSAVSDPLNAGEQKYLRQWKAKSDWVTIGQAGTSQVVRVSNKNNKKSKLWGHKRRQKKQKTTPRAPPKGLTLVATLSTRKKGRRRERETSWGRLEVK